MAPDPETHDYKFEYNGSERVVTEAVTKPTGDGHEIIVGREVSKAGHPSGEVKAYRKDRIERLEEIENP